MGLTRYSRIRNKHISIQPITTSLILLLIPPSKSNGTMHAHPYTAKVMAEYPKYVSALNLRVRQSIETDL